MIIIISIIILILLGVTLLFMTGIVRRILIKNFRKIEVKEQADLKRNLRIKRDVFYVELGSDLNKLDIILPDSPKSILPVIVNVHGGGLIGGDKSVNLNQSCYFAQQGYAVINLNYSLMPEVGFKEMIQDVFVALHWLTENADNYQLDLAKVFMTGDSAGGMLVSIVAAVLSGPQKLQAYYDVSLPDFKLTKIALTCPMVGTEVLVKPDNLVNWIFHYILGKKITDDTLAMEMADIYQLFDKSDYPELFILTTKLDSGFYYQAQQFTEFLTAKNIPHTFKSYASQGNKLNHVFNVSHPHWQESRESNDDIISFFVN